ncbi:hypothetical protein PENTCL1PPCAC_25736 [Pristionchus entomophagus]|uniref:G protein-coupled receptor n=1 Tax=Pristionchus entomophagus TaxID=358040 RepID=A0AAV5U9U0_9BILA|nr:hypothetical protein PENTCL1PPCAC_25736 [Pristionchus entomophagus]
MISVAVIIMYVLRQPDFNPWIISIALFPVGILISGFYGIQTKRPCFIIPLIIATGICLVFVAVIFGMIFLNLRRGNRDGLGYLFICFGVFVICTGYFPHNLIVSCRIIIGAKKMHKFCALSST